MIHVIVQFCWATDPLLEQFIEKYWPVDMSIEILKNANSLLSVCSNKQK